MSDKTPMVPPLPAPKWDACDPNTCEVCEPVYTADQMREYGALCAAAHAEEVKRLREALTEILAVEIMAPEGGHEEVLEIHRIARAALQGGK